MHVTRPTQSTWIILKIEKYEHKNCSFRKKKVWKLNNNLVNPIQFNALCPANFRPNDIIYDIKF